MANPLYHRFSVDFWGQKTCHKGPQTGGELLNVKTRDVVLINKIINNTTFI